MSQGPEDIRTELAALADGTLPAERREQLLAHLADAPDLAAELEHQRRAVAIVRSLETVQAPSVLRRSLETLSAGDAERLPTGAHLAPDGAPRRSLRLLPRVAAGVALAVVAVVAVTLALTAGGGGTPTAPPTVLQASSVALRPATLPAPTESPRNHNLLTASAVGIPYPYWGGSLGWNATGARTDTVGGRTVATVFYADSAARRIGYSIVSGSPLPVPAASPTIKRHGVSFRIVRASDPTVVTWREAGHTCILRARGVAAGTLVRLAAWQRT